MALARNQADLQLWTLFNERGGDLNPRTVFASAGMSMRSGTLRMSQMPWKRLRKRFSSQIGGSYLNIWMLTSRLSWDVPDNAALFGGPTVWQLAARPDGLAAHPNISLCCIQRPFQEGWQQKRMLEINSLVVSFQGKA